MPPRRRRNPSLAQVQPQERRKKPCINPTSTDDWICGESSRINENGDLMSNQDDENIVLNTPLALVKPLSVVEPPPLPHVEISPSLSPTKSDMKPLISGHVNPSPLHPGREISPAMSTVSYFKDQRFASRYETSFKDRKVLKCRVIDLEYFETQKIQLKSYFDALGISHLVSEPLPIYPALVRMFYSNAIECDNHIKTYVKGKEIFLTPAYLSEVLNISLGHPFRMEKELAVENLRSLTEISDASLSTFNASRFSLSCRLVHLVITHFLLHRSGAHDRVSEKSIGLLYRIVRGHSIDFASVFLDQMRLGIRCPIVLPLGMIITRILMASQVDLDEEECIEIGPLEVIGKSTLIRMHYTQHDGQWIPRAPSSTSPNESIPAVSFDPPQQSSPIRPLNIDDVERCIQPVIQSIRRLEERVQQTLQQVLGRIEALEGRFKGVEDDISYMKGTFS